MTMKVNQRKQEVGGIVHLPPNLVETEGGRLMLLEVEHLVVDLYIRVVTIEINNIYSNIPMTTCL